MIHRGWPQPQLLFRLVTALPVANFRKFPLDILKVQTIHHKIIKTCDRNAHQPACQAQTGRHTLQYVTIFRPSRMP